MSIRVLPKATSHLLGSAQVFTTPESVVKELVDNALDAKATSIDVVISANTLDRIEVRDNGHGIAPSDLDALGRRGYTSKLRKFEDVRTIGGSTLGFRGEALASATELGEISVTTRTEGEAVATQVRLGSHGGVASQTSTSHPIGTTVCVLNFFSKLPVRKENALKRTKNFLLRIKELLQSYVLARLNIRFSLKMLKTKTSTWLFAPGSNDSIREIVSRAIGRDIAAQCTEEFDTLYVPAQPEMKVTGSSFDAQEIPYDDDQNQKRRNTSFVIHAFIPKLDADFSKISGGQYLSIDSRPVSCARGTPKKIIGVYKSALRAVAADTVSEKIKSPFIRLDIMCPPGSYDANVEPAKDNVLFEDDASLLSLLERWFNSIYVCQKPSLGIATQKSQEGDADLVHSSDNIQQAGVSTVDSISSPESSIGENAQGFDRDIQRNPIFVLGPDSRSPKPSHDDSLSYSQTQEIDVPNVMDNRETQIDLPGEFCGEASSNSIAKGGVHELPNPQIDPVGINSALNPWLIAKLNARVTQSQPPRFLPSSFLSTPNKRQVAVRHDSFNSHISPVPPKSYHTPTRERTSGMSPTSSSSPKSSLEIWLKQNKADHSRHSDTVRSSPPALLESFSRRMTTTSRHGDLVTARQELHETPWSPPPTQGKIATNQPREYSKSFVSPFMKPQPAGTQPPISGECTITDTPSSRISQNEEAMSDIPRDMTMQVNQQGRRQADIDDALDFERRKEAATRLFREERRHSRSKAEALSKKVGDVRSSSSLEDVGIASLVASQKLSTVEAFPERVPVKTCLPDDDPRAYLMRRQRSVALFSERHETAPKLKRSKTLLLPLETVPRSAETHNLVQFVSTDIVKIKKMMLELKSHDEHSDFGCQTRSLDIPSADLARTERKLQDILGVWLYVTTGEKHDVDISLSSLEGRSISRL